MGHILKVWPFPAISHDNDLCRPVCWLAGWDFVEKLQAGDPAQVGSYQLLGRLGSGGMGRVFLARSLGGRLVAVKLIRADLASDPDFRSRFAREVAAARRVSGIFTAPVVDADPDAVVPWLVTGYVDGPSLADVVAANGPMAAAKVEALARGLAEGLAAIHAAGVVHRDLKPSNVLLASDGPRIIDFGISRAAEATSMTGTGMVVGSPGFMSPEQASSREVSAASDVFSLGAVLAYAATGREPFGTGAASALLYRVVHAEPALDGIPAELRPLIEWCLDKEPRRRPSPADLLMRLATAEDDTYRGPKPEAPALAPASRALTQVAAVPGPVLRPERRIRRWWIAAAAVVILGGAGTGIAAAAHQLGSTRPPSGSTHHSSASNAAVVRAFIGAINKHDWHQVWQLGGKNLGSSYASMVAGFKHTSRDVLTSLTTRGDTVTAYITAYETTGAHQTYALSYVVKHGVITSGHQKLLSPQS
jgi:serine/threonine protein kinase